MLLSVSFVISGRGTDCRVSHGGTEGTEGFQGFVCFSRCPLGSPGGAQIVEFRTEARRARRGFKDLFASLGVLCDLHERHRLQSAVFRTEAQRAQRVFKALPAPLSVTFVISVRGRIVHRGFSTLFLLPLRVLCGLREIQNGMGGTKYFAQRLRGTEVFKALATPLSLAFVDSVRGRISHGGFSTLFLLPLRVLCDLREI